MGRLLIYGIFLNDPLLPPPPPTTIQLSYHYGSLFYGSCYIYQAKTPSKKAPGTGERKFVIKDHDGGGGGGDNDAPAFVSLMTFSIIDQGKRKSIINRQQQVKVKQQKNFTSNLNKLGSFCQMDNKKLGQGLFLF
ncbi:hypothetical protein DERP_010781 [Dermatophagoides pteronyssinus]|uniref:Uncharacterized protein n=1 Tax=Dermatophagoides pteronyssinus TaxID=6956 RepID=A0ABQ8J6R0_DERPT|nr:hypothetical protein DERP_010781 [Dermatophagoides pteronyssinus]